MMPVVISLDIIDKLLLNCLSSTYRHLYTQHVTNYRMINNAKPKNTLHPVNTKTIKSLQLCHNAIL